MHRAFRRLASIAQAQEPSRSLLRSWKVWVPVVALGGYFAFDAYAASINDDARDPQSKLASPAGLQFLKFLPTRAGSSLWGRINEVNLPVWARRPVLSLYSWAFNCNLEEAENSDLLSYPCLQQFFGRKLKAGARIIDETALLVSPADSKVLHFGELADGKIEQVKGVTYNVKDFLGELPSPGPNNKIFQIVLYLAPGDYHHFHSSASWEPTVAHHYSGHLFSVSPLAAKIIPDLFVLNERVVLSGTWKHGFFSYVAVGAYNVGSISIDALPNLKTNSKDLNTDSPCKTQILVNIKQQVGDHVGAFRLGSTVVLVFEAPETFTFKVRPNQKLQYGQALGTLPASTPA